VSRSNDCDTGRGGEESLLSVSSSAASSSSEQTTKPNEVKEADVESREGKVTKKRQMD